MNLQRNKVRIIGGDFRRRVLTFPDAPGLRPTPDRVRETVFNWLGQTLYGKRCLDLFAGSGAFGLEAASRGASSVVMVEKDRNVAASLSANAAILQARHTEVKCMDALPYLKTTRERFDVIFVDPPYQSALLSAVLPLLPQVLASEGVVYLESKEWPVLEGFSTLRSAKAGLVCYGLIQAPVRG